MGLLERYAQAVNSEDLTVDERTTWADTDVLGAAGLAAKHYALGLALTRLFADGKPEQVVRELAEMAFKRARTLKIKQSRVQADDLAKAVLGWYIHGICVHCDGTGYQMIPDTPVHGADCPHCKTTGRLNFDRLFDRGLCEDCWGVGVEVTEEATYVCSTCDGSGARFLPAARAEEQLKLARWLSGEIDREQAAAGSAAMAMLAPRLDL